MYVAISLAVVIALVALDAWHERSIEKSIREPFRRDKDYYY
jgi:hypothetical protein